MRADARHEALSKTAKRESELLQAVTAERRRADEAQADLSLARKALSAAMLGWSDAKFDTVSRALVQPLLNQVLVDLRQCDIALQEYMAVDPEEHRAAYVQTILDDSARVESELRKELSRLQARLDDAIVEREAAATDLELSGRFHDAVRCACVFAGIFAPGRLHGHRPKVRREP
jgi:hypothetical protein